MDLSLVSLLKFCSKHQTVVMNAVQYPLDPKVAQRFPDADPAKNLGFSKVSGPDSYKKRKQSLQVTAAMASLRSRLMHPTVSGLPVYSLGNDSEWWVRQALGEMDFEQRYAGKIPHPSAWWRRGGSFGKIAEAQLQDIFKISK